ncbi:MAG: hypothetical protein NTX53_19940 [candidate division WOR-3 bacterium]|nr:hypothetical protein [candidate division WOR-3 bacterium]
MQDFSAPRQEKVAEQDRCLLGISGPLRPKWLRLRPGRTHFGRQLPEGNEWNQCDRAAQVEDRSETVDRKHAIVNWTGKTVTWLQKDAIDISKLNNKPESILLVARRDSSTHSKDQGGPNASPRWKGKRNEDCGVLPLPSSVILCYLPERDPGQMAQLGDVMFATHQLASRMPPDQGREFAAPSKEFDALATQWKSLPDSFGAIARREVDALQRDVVEPRLKEAARLRAAIDHLDSLIHDMPPPPPPSENALPLTVALVIGPVVVLFIGTGGLTN